MPFKQILIAVDKTPSLPAGELVPVVNDEAEKVFAILRGSASLPVGTEDFLRLGRPAETVIQVAQDGSADLIVVGTHSRSGVDRALRGSVADEIAREARRPVLVVDSER